MEKLASNKQFPLYRGLQRPLVFKFLKGRYIYFGMGSVLVGLVVGMVVLAMTNLLIGVGTIIGITGGGLLYTTMAQKKGLNKKTKHVGVFVVRPMLK